MAGTPTASLPLQLIMLIIASVFILKYTDNFGYISQIATELVHGKKGCLPVDTIGNISLHYFATRGKLEPIRMLLEDANIDYKETRFTKENWPQNKQIGIDSGLYKFGQVPAMVTSSGVMLSQSGAVLRFLARFAGSDCDCSDYERCESIAATLEDCRTLLGKTIYNFSDATRLAYFSDVAPVSLGHLERITPPDSSESVFMIGNRVTFIDYLTFNLIENHLEFAKFQNDKNIDVLANLPKLMNFYKSFGSRVNLKAYINSSQRFPFTVPAIKKN